MPFSFAESYEYATAIGRNMSPKYVLSLDRFDYSRDGIAHINIVDFLLGKQDINLS